MPRLDRTAQGVIFFDDFNAGSASERWVVTPSLPDRYSLTDRAGYLRMKHADTPTYIITDIPDSETFMFEMKNDYKPVVSNDTGGLVVYKTLADRVELIEYYDQILDVTRNYLYLRMYKKGTMYDCYGSQDATMWELIGSTRIEDAAKIGMVLNGTPNIMSVPLDIDYVCLYNDRYVYVENLQEGMVAKLYDSSNNLIDQQTVETGRSVTQFDMFNIPLPFSGYIELYSLSGALLYKTASGTINPGDEFQYEMDVDVNFQVRVFVTGYDSNGNLTLVPKFITNTDLKLDDVTYIGNMSGAYIEGIVTVKNNDPEDIINLQASIQLYDNWQSTHIVKVAADNLGEPAVYTDNVIINVPANSSNFFWMKIITTDIPTLSKYDTFKYKLVLKNA